MLAQYYDTSKPLNTHAYVLLANYDHQKMKDAVSNTWVKGYALIGNINTLLEHCEKNRNVLSDKGYHIIKGEALALRAMLHFDLLRIFGPPASLGRDFQHHHRPQGSRRTAGRL